MAVAVPGRQHHHTFGNWAEVSLLSVLVLLTVGVSRVLWVGLVVQQEREVPGLTPLPLSPRAGP